MKIIRNMYKNKTFACFAISCLSFFVIFCVHYEEIENYLGINRRNDGVSKDEENYTWRTNFEDNEEMLDTSYQNNTETCVKDHENNSDIENDENQTILSTMNDNLTAEQIFIKTLIVDKSERIENLLSNLNTKYVDFKNEFNQLSNKKSVVEGEVQKIANKQVLMENDIFEVLDNQLRFEQILIDIQKNQKKMQIDIMQIIEDTKLCSKSAKTKK